MFRLAKLVWALFPVPCFLFPLSALAETITWTGGAGTNNWHAAANWDLNRVPGPGDDVVIPDMTPNVTVTFSSGTTTINSLTSDEAFTLSGGTLNINGASSLNGAFTLSGTLGGSGNVTVTGAMSWSGGAQTGTGTTTINAGATLTMAGGGGTLSRVLDNFGAATWSSSGCNVNGGTFNNRPGASFTAALGTASGSWLGWLSGPNAFNNQGTFIKTGTGTASFGAGATALAFNNLAGGSVNLKAGTLALDSGGSHADDFAVAASSTLRIGGNHTFAAGADITGAGNLIFSPGTSTLAGTVNIGGTATFNGSTTINGPFTSGPVTISGTANFNVALNTTTLTLTAGTLGGSGNVTVTVAMSWSGGSQTGSGTTIIAAGATLTMAGGGGTLSRVLDNFGAATWSSSGCAVSGGTFNNRPGASFTAGLGAASGSWTGIGGTNAFNNQGMFIKTGTGAASFAAAVGTPLRFNNNGTVDVQAGTLASDSGGSHADDFAVAASSTLRFGGNHTFAAGADITGAGDLTFVPGTSTFAGMLNIGGTVTIAHGAAVSFNVPVSIPTLTLSGTLGGSGNVTVSGAMTWNGVQTGTGVTTIAAGATLTMTGGGGGQLLRVVDNFGTATWSSGAFHLINGTFNNRPGASFTAALGAANFNWIGGTGTNDFNNEATFIKTGAGTAAFVFFQNFLNFNNLPGGNVDVQAGTLCFEAGGNHTGGDFAIGPGATLCFSDDHTFGDGANITVDGGTLSAPNIVNNSTLSIASGAITTPGVLGAGNDGTLSGGTGTGNVLISGGTVSAGAVLLGSAVGGSGDLTISAGDLTTNKIAGNDVIVNGGTVTVLDEPGGPPDPVLDNSMVGGYFRDGAFYVNAGSVSTPNIKLGISAGMTGTYEQTGGTLDAGSIYVGSSEGGIGAFRWSGGTLIAQSLEMAGPATLGVSLSGPDLGDGYAQLQISGNAALTGTLEISLADGFEPEVGNSFVILTFGPRSGGFTQVAGTAAGPGKLFRVQYNPNDVTLHVEAAAPGDCDGDGGVDLDDYEAFTACLDGPGVTGAGCECADFDEDDDADLADFAEVQVAFTE